MISHSPYSKSRSNFTVEKTLKRDYSYRAHTEETDTSPKNNHIPIYKKVDTPIKRSLPSLNQSFDARSSKQIYQNPRVHRYGLPVRIDNSLREPVKPIIKRSFQTENENEFSIPRTQFFERLQTDKVLSRSPASRDLSNHSNLPNISTGNFEPVITTGNSF